MIVRCPQCQYANKAEMEASKPRIVCARCATVISVEFLSSYTPTAAELAADDAPEQSFMQTHESTPMDIENLLEPEERDVQAPVKTAVETAGASSYVNGTADDADDKWDTDEILDIPRNSQNPTPPNVADTGLKLDDVLASEPAAQSTGIPIIESMDAHDNSSGLEGVLAGEVVGETGSRASGGNGGDRGGEDGEGGNGDDSTRPFGQDSYDFRKSTFVMVSPDRKKSQMVKIFLAGGVLCALLAFGAWVLTNQLKSFLNKTESAASVPAAVPARPADGSQKPAPAASQSAAAATSSATTQKPAPAASVFGTPAPAKSAAPAPTVAAKASVPAAQPSQAVPAAKPPAQPAGTGHAVNAGAGNIALQFASYKSQGEAQQMQSRLKAAGVDARIVKADLPGKGTWFRVQGGRFANEGDAARYGAELKSKGTVKDYIVTGFQN